MIDNLIETIRQIKADGGIPRVHGNGFIQLDIDKGHQRLHIWGPQIPFKQSVYSGIHNHVFSFESICLVGELVHTRIDVELGADNFTHYAYQAVCHDGTDNTVLEKVEQAALVSGVTEYIKPWDTYTFEAGEYHETDAGIPTATLMTVTANNRDTIGDPTVLCDKAFHPSNDFTRYQNPDILWGIIFETLT